MGLMCARFCVNSAKLAKNDVLQKEHKIEILTLSCLLNILQVSNWTLALLDSCAMQSRALQ